MGRTRLLIPFASLLAAATTYLFFFTYCYVGYYNDDAYYIIGARALVRGSFSYLNKPGNPPIVEFLPGYSLLLAPAVWAFPRSLLALQCSTLLFCLGSLALAWRHLAGKLNKGWRPAFIALAALQPSVLGSVGNVMAEPAYLCLSLLILWLYGRWSKRMTPARSALFGALLGFSIFVRPMGAALIAALLAAAWAAGRRASAARMAGVAAAMFGAWWLRNNLASGSNGYPFHQAREWTLDLGGSGASVALSLLSNLLENVRFYFFAFARDMFRLPLRIPPPWGDAYDLLTGLAFWAAVWRGAAKVRKEVPAERGYALGLLAILAAWIHDLRYMLTLSPLLVFFFIKGLEKLPGAVRRPWAAGLAGLALLSATSGAVALAGQVAKPNRFNAPAWETFAWIRENTPEDAVLLCSMGGRTHLYTGRKTQEFPSVLLPGQLRDFLRSSRTGYVLLSPENLVHNPKTGAGAQTLLREPGLFERVYLNPAEGTLILKLSAAPTRA